MKTKNIFKTVVFAMLMPTMLLTTACSSEDDLVNNTAENTETVANKGYALPVTVNVSRQGDEGTRATYDGEKRKLSFSEGDKLFVKSIGSHAEAGQFAGTLDYDAVSGKFSGTMTTEKEYTGTIDDLMASAVAFLLPAGYGSYEFFSIEGSGYDATISYNFNKAFALTKAAAVEQFSVERAFSYSSGFALAPMNAIVSFTISGLTANKEVAVSFDTNGIGVISGYVTTSAEGVATFAVGVLSYDKKLEDCTLTVDGNNIAMPTKTVEAGHIYNISRSVAAAPAATDLSTLTDDYEAKDGETLTGTLGSNVKISIADGAKVTLKDVNINGSGTWTSGSYAGITCAGDATITLEGTNTVKGFHAFYPGIYVPEGKTLTIEGEGSLNASGNGLSTGIGGGFNMNCGDIVINGGNITATGGFYNAGIGGGGVDYGDEGVIRCGKITINGGTVTAKGGECAAGIGCGNNGASNDITITGGTVEATGGENGAGIGSGEHGSCGAINISGGTVTATGVKYGAGIGGGNNNGASGTITITSGVTQVTATKGSSCLFSIGKGDGGEVITVVIDDYDKVIQN